MEITSNINTLKMDAAKSKNLLMTYGPAVLTAILVILIASKLVNMTWLLLDKPTFDATPSANASIRPGDDQIDHSAEIESIRTAQLFGSYVEPKTPEAGEASTQIDDVPTTSIRDLTLKGTVASTSDDNGLAIIEYKGEENVYTVGDTISSGISLNRVFATEIHLSRGGVVEKLELPKLADTPQQASPRGNARANNRARESLSRTSRDAATASRSSVPAKLGDLLRPQPVFQNGKQLGYRVYPGRKREQFKALGLKAGDLVTEINGSPLDDPSRGLEIFRSLNETTQVSVTVQRNGAQTSLVLDTSQLNAGSN